MLREKEFDIISLEVIQVSKKISRNVKRRLRIFGPITIFILIFCITSIFTYFYNIYSLKIEEQQLQQRLNSLKEEEENLSDEILKLKDPDYIAKYARENYYYTKNGEYVIKIDEETNEEEIVLTENNTKAYYLIGIVLIVLNMLIFFLLIKSKKNKEIKK